MLISLKYNFVFLCMPKCASTSIENMLNPYSDLKFLGSPSVRHTSYTAYNKHISPYLDKVANINSIETICLLREPLSWLNSWYRFRARHQLRNPNNPYYENSTSNINFSEFVEAYMSPNPPAYAKVGSQYDFIKDDAGNNGIDRIFLLDNMEDFVEYMSRKVGKDLSVSTLNTSPGKSYDSGIIEWADNLRRKVGRKLNAGKIMNIPKPGPALSDELKKSIYLFMAKDYELYESQKIR